jgi:hypothetical protein
LKALQPTHLILYFRDGRILEDYTNNFGLAGWKAIDQTCQKISSSEIGNSFSVCVLKVQELL